MKNLAEFIEKLAATTGSVTVERGVAAFEDGTSFDISAVLKPAYIIIQQGGSTSELYLHAHDSIEAADAARVNCEENGSYQTSPAVEVPAVVAALGSAFFDVADALVDAALEI